MMISPAAPRVRQAFTALRIAVAALLFIHGTYRVWDGGVVGFGGFLSANHMPFGVVVAGFITTMEVCGTIVLASGRFVRPLALYYAFELTMGIILVHSPNGWFVVGGGRNGMEYSVLLITILLAQAWAAQAPAKEA